jgi:rhodanese-related sulfurtransferase
MDKTLSKLCYCQSARHARAAVRALETAGYAARTDSSGYVFVDSPTDAALAISRAAIKAA